VGKIEALVPGDEIGAAVAAVGVTGEPEGAGVGSSGIDGEGAICRSRLLTVSTTVRPWSWDAMAAARGLSWLASIAWSVGEDPTASPLNRLKDLSMHRINLY